MERGLINLLGRGFIKFWVLVLWMEEKEKSLVQKKSNFKIFIKWFLIVGVIAIILFTLVDYLVYSTDLINETFMLFFLLPNILSYMFGIVHSTISKYLSIFIYFGLMGGCLALIKIKEALWFWILLVVIIILQIFFTILLFPIS
jgi:magnesium-transporting ATPase (P-type)